jgi:hypothetical protein
MTYKFLYYKWEEVNFTWTISISMGVSRRYLNVIRKVGGSSAYVKGNPWDVTKRELGEEKTKRIIKLFCKVNNLDYQEVLEKRDDIKITVEQVEKVINEAIKVGVKI